MCKTVLDTDPLTCPVCNRSNTSEDTEPNTSIRACDDCGSEYIFYSKEITMDARDELSTEEIKQRNYNPL